MTHSGPEKVWSALERGLIDGEVLREAKAHLLVEERHPDAQPISKRAALVQEALAEVPDLGAGEVALDRFLRAEVEGLEHAGESQVLWRRVVVARRGADACSRMAARRAGPHPAGRQAALTLSIQ